MGEIAEALRRAHGNDAAEDKDGTQALDDRPGREHSMAVEFARQLTGVGVAPVDSEAALLGSPRSAPTAARSEPGVRTSIQTISRRESPSRAERIALIGEKTAAGACARRLAQKVKRRAAQMGARSIVVTSALRGDGKTTTACNLAVSISRLDHSQSVLLVDLDLRRPSIVWSLGLSPTVSIEEVLEHKASLDEALLPTDVPGLTVLGLSTGNAQPERLLASHNLKALLDSLERRFSCVIIDSPPVLAVPDAASVIDAADAFVFVASARRTPTRSIEAALEHLPREKALGCVLNHAREANSTPTDYYAYSQEVDHQAERTIEESSSSTKGQQ